MSKAWNPDDIFDVLASEDVRQILVATNVRSMSVKELADICDRSLATIYRRIQAMENYNLVSEEITRDADGTQYSEYKSELNEITISVEEGQLDININIEKDTVDQFAELIEDLEQSQKQDDQSDTDS
ncbi:ArsR/SmtB family transcription factor [Haloquadratum walsbyi]|uniref:ArsR family transcription regulator n=1 Tax=Haloquadratum walsbyi (strain DSM 16854 / JCM 12705 / C23) TaxID=768065 RepID=G0LKQ6_HALWC|nr:helix-turn-helix domain-containing protein [Haloquadratum walsbyi]CCC40014.1 ArsR family transcription regulator [Haloquadratum walsbyi C23]